MNYHVLMIVPTIVIVQLLLLPYPSSAFSIRELVKGGGKRMDARSACPAWHPFQCPNGDCVPIKYLCDGSPDCSDGYDENVSMCTAATRPPVEETASFLKALLSAHGDNFLTKVFGTKAAAGLSGFGGVDKVAVALSQSPTAKIFATEVGLSQSEADKMVNVMLAIVNGGDSGELSANEAADFAFFVQKLHETGFF